MADAGRISGGRPHLRCTGHRPNTAQPHHRPGATLERRDVAADRTPYSKTVDSHYTTDAGGTLQRTRHTPPYDRGPVHHHSHTQHLDNPIHHYDTHTLRASHQPTPTGSPVAEAENPQAAPDTGRADQADAAAHQPQPQQYTQHGSNGGEAQQPTQPSSQPEPEQTQQAPNDIPPGLWDGRTLRQSQREGNAQTTAPTSPLVPPSPRQKGLPRTLPVPQPSASTRHSGGDHTALIQRSISQTGAASSTDPFPPNVRRAILTQLQVIRDTASSLPGADLLVAMMDIAAQLVHSVPTAAPAAPEHSGEQTHERGQRGRKRPLTEPNALAEIMRYAASAGGEREPLPPNLMAEDLFFLMAELEAGALQLHEPLPGDIDIRTVQDAARRVQHTIHLLCSARDQSLAGGDKWNRPQFWREIAELVEPAVLIIDRRGDAFADDDGADLAHPADVAVLAREVPEAPARTGQTSSAALLLRDAADDFRCIVPSMVGEQQTLAVQLLQAVDYWFQAQFGGALAVHDGTQTDDMGDPLQSHVGENRPPATTGELAGGPAEERPTVQQQEDSYNSEPFTASKLGLYQECMEPLAASSQPAGGEDAGPMEHWRGWLGLQHTTASQAEAALGSLDLDALGEPTLPVAPASSLEQEVGSVLGHYCAMAPTPAGGSNRQLSACDASGPGRGEWRQQ